MHILTNYIRGCSRDESLKFTFEIAIDDPAILVLLYDIGDFGAKLFFGRLLPPRQPIHLIQRYEWDV